MTRGGYRKRNTNVTADQIVDTLRAAGTALTLGAICNQLALVDQRDRKAVANRLVTLVRDGTVHKSPGGMGARLTYWATGSTSTAIAVVEPRVEATVERSTISVDDACVGMLLGMTGATSVPIVELPAIAEWMRHTSSIVERLS